MYRGDTTGNISTVREWETRCEDNAVVLLSWTYKLLLCLTSHTHSPDIGPRRSVLEPTKVESDTFIATCVRNGHDCWAGQTMATIFGDPK
jgi:hypothetical protein